MAIEWPASLKSVFTDESWVDRVRGSMPPAVRERVEVATLSDDYLSMFLR